MHFHTRPLVYSLIAVTPIRFIKISLSDFLFFRSVLLPFAKFLPLEALINTIDICHLWRVKGTSSYRVLWT